MPLEQRDRLFHPVVEEGEIFLVQTAYRPAGRIFYRRDHADEAHVDFENGLLREEGGNGRDTHQGGLDHRCRTASSHSPSTHTSPSAKCSFFQIGTSFFRRLMPSKAASKAGFLCGALTTIRT